MSDERSRRTSEPARDERTGRSAARERIRNQESWVELQLRRAVDRGDFDNLPGYGKPIEGLGTEHDPDWWVKKLVEREQLIVLPPALALRREDAELDAQLDRRASERQVRADVEEFNKRVRHILYSTPGGPPVVTQPRDVEIEVDRWRSRREARRSAALAARESEVEPPTTGRGRGRASWRSRTPRRWWRLR